MDYTKIKIMADNKIGSFGDDFIVRCMTFGTYDSVADTYASSATSYDVKGLILDFSQRDIDGTLVQVGDKRLLLSALDSEGETLPALDQRENFDIIYNSKVLNVLGITPLQPGGQILLYKLHIRN